MRQEYAPQSQQHRSKSRRVQKPRIPYRRMEPRCWASSLIMRSSAWHDLAASSTRHDFRPLGDRSSVVAISCELWVLSSSRDAVLTRNTSTNHRLDGWRISGFMMAAELSERSTMTHDRAAAAALVAPCRIMMCLLHSCEHLCCARLRCIASTHMRAVRCVHRSRC